MIRDDSQFDGLRQQLNSVRCPQVPVDLLDKILADLPDEFVRPLKDGYRVESIRRNNIGNIILFGGLAILVLTVFLLSFGNHGNPSTVEIVADQAEHQLIALVSHETDPQFVLPPTRSAQTSRFPKRAGSKESFRNLVIDADSGNETRMWKAISVPKEGLSLARTADHTFEGDHSLAIYNTHRYETKASNNWCQEIHDLEPGNRIRLQVAVRTENATAANVCVQCWSDDQTLVGYCSTPAIRGSHEWTKLESGSLTIPGSTRRVIVRAALTGIGRVWFDNLRLCESPTESVESSRDSVRRSWQDDDVDDSVAIWIEQLGTADDRHYEALNRLIDLGKESIEPIRTILKDKDEALIRRWQSAMILSNVNAKPAIPEMFAILEEGDRDEDILHGVIIESFFNYRDEEVVSKLRSFAKEETTLVSIKETIESVLQDRTFYPFLKHSGESESSEREWEIADSRWVLEQADKELKGFDKRVASLIRQIGTSRDLHFEAFNELSGLGQDAEDPLRKVLCSKNQPLIRRWQSAMILSDRRYRKVIPDLLAILRIKDPEEETLHYVIIECLFKYEDVEVDRQLVAFANDSQTPENLQVCIEEQLEKRK